MEDAIDPAEVSEIVDNLLRDFGIAVTPEAVEPAKVDSMARAPGASWMSNLGRRKAG